MSFAGSGARGVSERAAGVFWWFGAWGRASFPLFSPFEGRLGPPPPPGRGVAMYFSVVTERKTKTTRSSDPADAKKKKKKMIECRRASPFAFPSP